MFLYVLTLGMLSWDSEVCQPSCSLSTAVPGILESRQKNNSWQFFFSFSDKPFFHFGWNFWQGESQN